MGIDTGISLLTLGDVKLYIEGTTTGPNTYDARYEEIINAVSVRFNNETGRVLKQNAYSEYYDGNGTQEMYLNQYPVSTSAVVVTIDDSYTFTTDYDITSTDIHTYYPEGKVWLYGHDFEIGHKNVLVEYTAGYTTSGMPADLKRAALETVQVFWNREEKKDRVGIRSESMEGGSRTFETDLPWSAKQILDNYRCKRFW